MDGTAFHRESAEVRRFLDHIANGSNLSEQALAVRAGQVLSAFANRLEKSDVPASSVLPARYAMAILVDSAVRDLPSVRTNVWSAAAHAHVFDRREMTVDKLRQFSKTAHTEGPEYDEFALFLDGVIEDIEGGLQTRSSVSRTPARVFGLAFVAYLVCLAGYIAFLDYRYHSDLISVFDDRMATLPEEASPDRLALVAQLHSEVTRASDAAPLSRFVQLPFWVSGERVTEIYRSEVAAILPDALREAIGEAIATEGDSISLYDNVRAWAILSGRTNWSSAYLAGWVEAREDSLGLYGLADHVTYLDGPEPRLAVPDEALMEQARDFATEATEAERSFLELVRLPGMRALGSWSPLQRIPEIEDVFVLRSGRDLGKGVPHAYTRNGWDLAKTGAIDEAIRIARIEAAKLLPRPSGASIDVRRQVTDRMQAESLAIWKAWLEDLRVRPFVDGKSAIVVSGALSREASPLARIVEEVWREAGGDDPTRPVANKDQINATFGPAVSYVRQGGISELSSLFATLNVALSTMGVDETRGIDALQSFQERARSVAALKEAPPLVAQIAEDVLAQTSAAHARVLSNPLTREWQARIYPVCQRAIDGRYPFHVGEDVALRRFDDFFGAGGALRRFYAQYASTNLDTTGDTWRWSTEARLNGVTPESAAFLQRAMTISQVFYNENRAFGTSFEMSPLAEQGQTQIRLGGQDAQLSNQGLSLAWPGTQPEEGMAVTFSRGGTLAEVAEPGLWGFLRLIDQTSLRNRDDGRRQLVDLRADGGRLFFEMSFPQPLNPVSARKLLKGITCPPVL
jgi:type VI protein secretion system component VasK